MIETKFINKTLFVESLDYLSKTAVVFSIEFDHNYKAILLRAGYEDMLYTVLKKFYIDASTGKYGENIKKCIEFSDSITVDVLVQCGYTYSRSIKDRRRVYDFLQRALARKIVELCTYTPYGYNIEIEQIGYKDSGTIKKLVEDILYSKQNGVDEVSKINEYIRVVLPEKRRKGAIVYSYDITDGHFVEQFESIRQAADTVGCSHTAIINACDGKALTAKGYAWSRHKYTQLPAFIGNEKWAAKYYSGQCGSRLARFVYKFDAITGELMEEFDTIQDAALRNKVWPAEIADACKAGIYSPIIINGRYIFTFENNNDHIEPVSLEDIRNADKNNVIRRRQLREQKKHEAFVNRQEKQAEEYSKKSNKERVYKKERVYHRYPKKPRPQENDLDD